MKVRSCLVWLLLCATAWAQGDAQAVIEGPNQARSGTLVVLDASDSTGSGFAWAIVPEMPENVAVDTSGKVLYFATPVTPGKWTVILAVASGDTVDLKTHILTVGQQPELKLALPETIGEGETAIGMVSAPGPAEIELQSDTPARLAVPATVTIPEGASSMEFPLLAPDNEAEDGDADVQILAKLGTTSVFAKSRVIDDEGEGPPPKALWGIVIHESSEPSPEKAIVLSSKRIREALEGRWKIADKDVLDQYGKIPADLKPWIEKAKSLPYLFLVDETGKVRYEGPLPLDVDEVLRLIELRGKSCSTKSKSNDTCPTGGTCFRR